MNAGGDAAAPARLAPLWRRGLADLVDSSLLSLLGTLLSAVFRKEFIAAGYGGRLVGLFLFCSYIGGQNSVLGRGQTLGKRLLRLRVVDAAGEFLPLERGMLRALILATPLLTSGLFVSFRSQVAGLVLTGLLSVLNVGVGSALLYLFTFNRGTRQSLHDWVVGSYVVRATGTAAPGTRRIWRGHFLPLALCVLLPLGTGPILWWFWSGGSDWQRVLELQAQVAKALPDARVEIMHGEFPISALPGGTGGTRYLRVGAVFPQSIESFEEAADGVAAALLADGSAVDADTISITVSYGYDLLVVSHSWSKTFIHSPREWQERLKQKAVDTTRA